MESGRILLGYMLGEVDIDSALILQRRLIYELGENPGHAALIICEHPPGVTIGREGSAGQVLFEPEELERRGWPVRWVNRGGGTILHLPGQIAVYPIFPLKQFEVGLEDYLSGLHQVLLNVLASHDIPAQTRPEQVGVWVNDRAIAHLGVAVWDWFAYFGFYLNVSPDPGPFRMMRTGDDLLPMTTMIRESRSERIRETRVRQELLTEFAKVFKLERVSVFHHHPGLTSKVPIHAIPAGPH